MAEGGKEKAMANANASVLVRRVKFRIVCLLMLLSQSLKLIRCTPGRRREGRRANNHRVDDSATAGRGHGRAMPTRHSSDGKWNSWNDCLSVTI
jgi:hypothetical protein